MKCPDRIQWHEGMLLSPQHFQLESARVDALARAGLGIGDARQLGKPALRA